MGPKDYYLILGVSRSEGPSGIRARYRDLARTLHPDVAGAQSTEAFQQVVEAYGVLADPAARRRHNAELALWERRVPAESVEPLGLRHRDPVSILAEPLWVRPSFDALVERFYWNFTGPGVPKAERPEALNIEVILTSAEALRGVALPIVVPSIDRCSDCGGAGHVWFFPCASCDGQGVISIERTIPVTVPPLVRSGAVIERPLQGLGIHNLYLRLYVRIE
jgi:molecular chaperone DnaJ